MTWDLSDGMGEALFWEDGWFHFYVQVYIPCEFGHAVVIFSYSV